MNRLVYIAAITLALVAAGTAADGQQFRKAVYYGTGKNTSPYAVVSAHLTNSGHLDLALADYVSDTVSILLGNGNGSFQKPLKFSLPAPIALAAGDFNGDGKEDLVVIESGGTGESLLVVFLGNGDGTFRKAGTGTLGVYSANIAVADFNGDGNLDVAVANRGFNAPGSVMVFFGDGKGNVTDRTTYTMAGGPWGIVAGDLNSDHHPDLAVALDLSGSVAVLLNDGTGKFRKPVSYPIRGSGVDVKIADLRNDGKQDLVVADAAEGMDILLNNGDGTFGKSTTYPPCSQCANAPVACTVADFNLDGKLDVACAVNFGYSFFYYGKGNGTFKPAIAIKETIQGYGGFSIAAGDFNNDQAPDLAIPIQNYGEVAILLNTQ